MSMNDTFLKVCAIIFNNIKTQIDFKRNSQAELSQLKKGLSDRRERSNSGMRSALVKRIVASYHAAKSYERNLETPSRWENEIQTRRTSFLTALNRKDIPELCEMFQDLFRNEAVTGVWSYGYYNDIANAGLLRKMRFINSILRDISIWKSLVDHTDITVLSPPRTGNPWGYMLNDCLIMADSCRLNYYAQLSANLFNGVKDVPVVAEIGGGYGGFAYYLLQQKKAYKYINFDLPEVLLICQYILMSEFPEKKFLLFGEVPEEISIEIIDNYDVILMPHFAFSGLASNSVDFFINTRSLSEMPYHYIEEYLTQISRTCKLWFFHENVFIGSSDEISSDEFPVPKDVFERVYMALSVWDSGQGRYREHLYVKKNKKI